jgi:hypothetical protein
MATVPGAPTNVRATAGDGRATVFWTPPTSNGGSALTGYTVTSSPGSFTTSVPGSVPFATVSGLTNGVEYTFTVIASNAIGPSAASAASTAVQPRSYTVSNWSKRGGDIDGEAAGDQSGWSVALSADGSIVAIGAKVNDGNGGNSGHVRVYAWNGTSWSKRGNDIDGEAEDDLSGWSVALSADGSIVAIGAPPNDGNGSYSGQVRVYAWNGTSWSKRGNDIDGEVGRDQSGYSVALSADGSIVAIGANVNDGNGGNSGHVRVYAWNGTSWIQRGNDIDGEAAGDQSGWSVALSADGSIVAIGAVYNDGDDLDSGQVRVYAWDRTSWIQRGGDIDGEAGGDQTGYSVALSADGSIVAIGAIGNDGGGLNSGHVRVYAWDRTSWIQRGNDIDGEADYDLAGWSVALSADGSIVAIGAVYNVEGGLDSGHVRMYAWNGTSWNKRVSDIDGEVSGDKSGWSVALSADGSTVAIGALSNDGNGSDSGQVRVLNIAVLPDSPINVVATSANAQAIVSWSPPLYDGDAPITSYTVSVSPGGTTTTVSTNTATITGLTNGTVYGITVSATNVVGTGAATTPVYTMPMVGGIPCFFGNARVLTSSGYRRMDSIREGDMVGNAAVRSIKVYTCEADKSTNPYVIPQGLYGAKRRLLISPDHKVCLADGRRVAAKHLGLAQEDRTGILKYYNLELEGGADMIVDGVLVESLQLPCRERITVQELGAMLREHYGEVTPAVLARVQRTCRFFPDGTVEVPMTGPQQSKPAAVSRR